VSFTITGQTRLVGVMGWPIKHSLSPQMHNAAFAALGMDCCYVPLPVPPDRVGEAVGGLRAMGFVGCNVTVPHKQAVQDHLDEVSEDAQAVGAVNTLVRRDDTWMGYNSDVPGFLESLTEAGFVSRGKRALLLGAGGAARSVAYALTQAGAAVTIMNRTEARAEALACDIADLFPDAALDTMPLSPVLLERKAEQADLLVNATTLGMWPEMERSPWPDDLAFPSRLTVFDLVYNPLRTRLIAQAEAAGARAISGLKMLVYQGAISFQWWFGIMPPVDVMYQVCWHELYKR